MGERQREGSRRAVQHNGRTQSVSHQEIELRHAASGSSFQAYAESGNLHLGAVIRNGLRNPGGWEFYPKNPLKTMIPTGTQEEVLQSIQAHYTTRKRQAVRSARNTA